MGWTIDVPPTPVGDFPAALDAARVRATPQGTLENYVRLPDGQWLAPHEDDPGTLRPEVVEQVAQAVEKAKAKAEKVAEAAVSASLVGHVQHPDIEHSEETRSPDVTVVGHPQEVIEQNAAHQAEKEAQA